MPKNTFVAKPALEKLPLAVRKDLRDNFESEKSNFESQIAEKLDIPSFTINFNMSEVWAYSTDSTSSAGYIAKRYVEGFIYSLGRYVDEYGAEGKLHFNGAVTKHELGLAVNQQGDQAETISADVESGVFRILFKQDSLGYNTDYLSDALLRAIETVPRSEGFSLIAKNSISKYWTEEIEDLQAAIGEILAMKDVVLDPNFAENYAALEKGHENKDWQAYFGRYTFGYFSDGLKYQLERQGFKADDMLQEGLAEAITSKTFKLRVVPSTKSTNEVVIENNVVYIQTTPANWGYNQSDAGSGLLELL